MNQEILNYIRQSATSRGIDPNIAVRVVQGEGGLSDPFRHGQGPAPHSQDPSLGGTENSYGPFQLYISGNGAGLGDRALAAGIDPRTDWKGGVDFALNEVAQKGWDQWYGAKAAGITGMQGVSGNAGVQAINRAIGAQDGAPSDALGFAGAQQPLPAGMTLVSAKKGDRLPGQQAPGMNDANDDILNQWLKGTEASQAQPAQTPSVQAPQGAVPQAQSDDDILKQFVGTPEAPTAIAQTPNAPAQDKGFVMPAAPPGVIIHTATKDVLSDHPDMSVDRATNDGADRNQSVQELALLHRGGFNNALVPFANGLSLGNLAPSVGAVNGLTSVMRGGNYGDAYSIGKAAIDQANQQEHTEHPYRAAAAQLAGGAVGILGAAEAAPAAFGLSGAPLATNIGAGMLTGSVLGGGTAALNSGGDLSETGRGALIGAAGGAAGPLIGQTAQIAGRASPIANILMGGGVGAALGGADAGIQSGGDLDAIKRGAIWGGAGGAALPMVGSAVGAGVNKLSDVATGSTPAARYVRNALTDIGMTPEDAQNALARLGPSGTLADVDPALADKAGALAASGNTGATSVLKNAYTARAQGADDRVTQIVNDHLGPAPDAQQILADIRTRAEANAPTAQTAKSALDNAMGTPVDPHTQLQNMIQTRTAAAEPLYKQALSQPIAWTDRLQQFIDEPIMQSALSKGVRIQRLESLKDGTPFDPNDYAISGFNEAGDPIISGVPNMRTLNVAKKGLDALVQADQDPMTGRLSDEGRAIDGVRREFLATLDKANPLYAQARQAWAGPSQAQDAFNKGLSVFRNQSGPGGVNSTPGALESWLSAASDGEKAAAQLGARSAFEQQMNQAADPAQKAANLTNLQANQQKLSTILGPQEAKALTDRLNFKYTDPVGSAFEKGMNIFQARQGTEGIEDTPGALKTWLNGASQPEVEALQQGARQTLEQALSTARQGDFSAARSLLSKSTANRQKLEMAFPGATKMLDALSNEIAMRGTENTVRANSLTASRQANAKDFTPPGAANGNGLSGASLMGHAVAGDIGGVALPVAKWGFDSLRNGLTQASRDRFSMGVAKGLSATGSDQDQFLQQLLNAQRAEGIRNALLTGSRYGASTLTNSVPNLLTGASPR